MNHNLQIYYDYIAIMKKKLEIKSRKSLGFWDLTPIINRSNHEKTIESFKLLTGLEYVNEGMKLMIFNNCFPKESWKRIIIDDIETNDFVSSYGNICRYKNNVFKLLTQSFDKDGYSRVGVCLPDNETWYTKKVHVLVASAFVKNPKNKSIVNHIDGYVEHTSDGRRIKNNFFMNLEWVTLEENAKHASISGLLINRRKRPRENQHLMGGNSPNSKYTEETIIQICELLQNGQYTPHEISELLDVNRKYITDLRKGRRWRHVTKGYDFSNVKSGKLGTNNPNARFTDEQIHELCQLIKNRPDLNIWEISRQTGISDSYITKLQEGVFRSDITSQYNFPIVSLDPSKSNKTKSIIEESSTTILETGVPLQADEVTK